jgi:hypothetical protein
MRSPADSVPALRSESDPSSKATGWAACYWLRGGARYGVRCGVRCGVSYGAGPRNVELSTTCVSTVL